MWPVGECSISRHWEHLKLRPVKVINEPLIISLTKYCAMARIRYLFRKGKRMLCLFVLGNCRYKILYKSTICWLFSFRFIFFFTIPCQMKFRQWPAKNEKCMKNREHTERSEQETLLCCILLAYYLPTEKIQREQKSWMNSACVDRAIWSKVGNSRMDSVGDWTRSWAASCTMHVYIPT